MSAAHSPRPVEAARTEWDSKAVRPLERGPVISLILPRGKSRWGSRKSGGAAKRHPEGSGANMYIRLLFAISEYHL